MPPGAEEMEPLTGFGTDADVKRYMEQHKDTQRHITGIAVRVNPMLRVSLGATAIRRDGSGNPAIDKSHWDARIDVAAAAVIACGLRAVAAKEQTGTLFRIAG